MAPEEVDERRWRWWKWRRSKQLTFFDWFEVGRASMLMDDGTEVWTVSKDLKAQHPYQKPPGLWALRLANVR
jgi:hypothetical protein